MRRRRAEGCTEETRRHEYIHSNAGKSGNHSNRMVVVDPHCAGVKRTATQILEGAGAIWTHGQLVANDTIQIPIFLKETNHVAGQILATATEIVGATDMIEQHAKGCPGCPACVLETGRER
jgi:hypothetical protein